MRNEGFNQIPTGIFDRFGTTEVRGIGFNQIGIEFVLPNEEAELVAESRRAGMMTVAARAIELYPIRQRFGRLLRPAELLNRAEADAVGFSQGPVDGPGFSNSHFGAADEWRDIGGIGIAVADKRSLTFWLKDTRFEDPLASGHI